MIAKEPGTYGLIVDSLNCAKLSRAQLERTRLGGVVAMNYTIIRPWDDFETAMAGLSRALDKIEGMADIATIALTSKDILQAQDDGRLAIIMGTQNSTLVENDLSLLSILHRLGFRCLQPTYNERNHFGDGAIVPQDEGLTELGRQWIQEMNHLNLLIDLSHCGDRTGAEAIEESVDPVIFSHANARELCNSPRNKSDTLIRAVADKGGIIGAVAWAPALRHETRPSVDDYFDQVGYLVDQAGVDHVSFASDMAEDIYTADQEEEWAQKFGPNGVYPTVTGVLGDWWRFDQRFPVGYESMAHTTRIWDGLLARGFSEDQVEKIMGGNLIRLFQEVWGE